MSCGGTESYFPTSLVRTVHNLYRFNKNLKSTSADFDITLEYAEGAASLPAIVILVGVVLFLVVLLFLCCCACRSSPTLQDRYTSMKKPGCGGLCLLFFAVLCCGAAGLGLYANQSVETGVTGISDSVQSVNATVVNSERDVRAISGNLQNSSTDLGHLVAAWNSANISDRERNELVDVTNSAKIQADEARREMDKISSTFGNFYDVTPLKTQLNKYEKYRWQGTIGAMCVVVLVALVAIFGVVCKSTCLLKLMVFMAIISLLVGWLVGAVFLGITVVGSDLCFAPNTFLNKQLNGTNYADTARYVIYCGNCPNPYQKDYDQASVYLYNISSQLDELHTFAVNRSVEDAKVLINGLSTSVGNVRTNLDSLWSQEINCTNLNAIYLHLLTSTCGSVIDGTAMMFAGAVGVGLFMFFVVLTAQRHWTRLKFGDAFEEHSETSQLLPPSERSRFNDRSRSSTFDNEQTPLYNSTSRRNRSSTQDRDAPEAIWTGTHLQTEKPNRVGMPPAHDAGEREVKQAWV